jgi:predicted ATP-grasp superfamily ATP-dependent carboligase
MDMETQQMMELLLDKIADINDQVAARQDKADAKIEAHLKRMEAATHSVRSDIEQTVQKRMEDVLLVIDPKPQSLQMELTEKIENTQAELQDSRDVPWPADEESLLRSNDRLPSTVSGLSREFESRPEGNGRRSDYIGKEFRQIWRQIQEQRKPQWSSRNSVKKR